MTFPLWALFGLGSAFLSACMMLLQERLKVNGYALAFWNKAACVLIALPFMLVYGLPDAPMFYILVAATAILYAISDVVFFSAIPKSSAGAVSRLIPLATIIGFVLWFFIDPSLLQKYLMQPVIFTLIFLTFCVFAFFAMRLKKCTVTMQALRDIWFVVFAATVGPMLTKLITLTADMNEARYAYVFIQALMMMVLWLIYLHARKPVPLDTFFAPSTWQRGLLIGLFGAGGVILKFTSFYYVDNPAYIPAIITLDSVIILAFYKFRGRPTQGDILSGMGVVLCAVALIILKAQI